MISVLEDSRNGGAYIIPTTSAAGGKVPEWKSDVESRTERRARGGFRLEAAFFAADRLMGMMCPAYGAFLRQGYRKCGEWYRMDTKERGIAANI